MTTGGTPKRPLSWLNAIKRLLSEIPFWQEFPHVDFAGRPNPQEKPPRGSLLRLLAYFKPLWWLAALVLLLTFVSASIGVIQPLLARQVVDVAIPKHNFLLLERLVLEILAVTLGVWSLHYVTGILYSFATNRVIRDLRADVYKKLMNMPQDFFAKEGTDAILSRMMNDIGVVGSDFPSFTGLTGVFSTILGAVHNFATIASTVVAILILSPRFGITLFLVMPPFLVFSHYASKIYYGITRGQFEQFAGLNRRIGHVVRPQYAAYTRRTNISETERKNFYASNHRVSNLGIMFNGFNRTYNMIYTFLPTASVLLVYWFGGKAIIGGALSLGTLLAFVSYANRIDKPVQSVAGIYASLRGMSALSDRVFYLMDQEEITAGDQSWPTGELTILETKVGLGEAVVLPEVDENQFSTLAHALVGVRNLEANTVFVGDIDAVQIMPSHRRHQVSIVSSDAFILFGNLRDNLLVAKSQTTDVTLLALGQDLFGDLFTHLFPEGLDTIFGNQDLVLPLAEERQAISLMRAVLWQPRIIMAAHLSDAVWSRVKTMLPDVSLVTLTPLNEPMGAHTITALGRKEKPTPIIKTREPRQSFGQWFSSLGLFHKPKTPPRHTFWRFVLFGKPYFLLIGVQIVAAYAAASLDARLPLIGRTMINKAFHMKTAVLLGQLITAYIGITIFAKLVSLIDIASIEVFINRTIRDIRNAVYDAVQRMPAKLLGSLSPGKMMAVLMNDVNSIYIGIVDLEVAPFLTLNMIPRIIAMMALNWHLGLVVFLTMPPIVAIVLMVAEGHYRLHRRLFDQVAEMTSHLERACSASGMAFIQSFGLQEKYMAEFQTNNRVMSNIGLGTTFVLGVWSLAYNVKVDIVNAILWYFGGLAIMHGYMSLGTLIAMIAFSNTLESFGSLYIILLGTRDVMGNVDRVFSFLEEISGDDSHWTDPGLIMMPPTLTQTAATASQGAHAIDLRAHERVAILSDRASKEIVWQNVLSMTVAHAGRVLTISDDVFPPDERLEDIVPGRSGHVVDLSAKERYQLSLDYAKCQDQVDVWFVFDPPDAALSHDRLCSDEVTTVYITSEPHTVFACDRVFMLAKGNLVEQGDPSELLAREGSELSRWLRQKQLHRPLLPSLGLAAEQA